MSEYRDLSFEELCDALEQPAATLILLHRGPDGDAVGSAFALRQVLESLGSEAWCICADEVPDRLRFLCEGLQESLLPEAVPEDFAPQRIISVDVASPGQLGSLREIYEGQIDIMIDHHENGMQFADCFLLPGAAATGEILFDIVKLFAQRGLVPITEPICTDLYAAISSDTGCFRYSNVTPETHARAAELVASGIDCAGINHRLFETRSLDQLRAMSAGISHLNLFADGKIAVILFPFALKAALNLRDEHLETLVDVARSLEGVEVAVSIRQPSTEAVFRVSMRSCGSYNVAELCARFGGGGHDKAAGCTISAKDAEEAMEKIVNEIDVSELS